VSEKIFNAEPDSGVPVIPTLGSLLQGASSSQVPESLWVGLVHSIATGDQAALRDLYGRVHAPVFTLVLRIVRDQRTAEEVTIDVFHQVWKRAHTYQSAGGTVVGWVMNQARSRAIDQIRFEGRKKRVNPFPESHDTEEEPDSGELLDSRCRETQLRAAVARLTPKERSAIEMAFFSECTHAEVAVRLQEPEGTVKSRIRSGLEKLRQALTSPESS
jgi:RNA polymerase sigma-70 factor, ECF subfamily